jgi:4-amino-4-deoxychorismate lyase
MNAPIQLIETMRVEPGKALPGNTLPLLNGHMRRLERSCRALGYAWPGDSLIDAILQCAAKLDSNRSHRMRLLLGADGRYTLETGPLAATHTPVRLRLHPAPLDADPFWLSHKTTNRPWYAQASAWLAQNPGFFDVVYCNERDEVCEGTRCNVYVLNAAGIWLTPPLECGVLPGVQRQELMDQGKMEAGVITRAELIAAPQIRISNALRGWLPADVSHGERSFRKI